MLTSMILYGSVAVVLSAATFWGARKLSRRWMAWAVSGLAATLFVLAATVLAWAVVIAAGDRSARSIDFGMDLEYERIALDTTHRQVFHLAVADLDNPCLGLVTTRLGLNGSVAAETGTEFVERTGVALSINVAFFDPLTEYPYWSAYPQSGDPVTAIGPSVIDGEWVGNSNTGGGLGLAFTDGRLSVGQIQADADFAVRGNTILVTDGQFVAPAIQRNARSVAGIDLDTNRLLLVVSDGKQPGYAVGSSYQDIAEFLIARGVDHAIEFDGGGSSTMAANVEGRVELLNRPIHQRLPGRQRPVASHMGIAIDPDC